MKNITDKTISNSPCIKIERVNRSFGKKQVLFDINLDIPYAQI